MGTVVDLVNEKEEIVSDLGNIVIVNHFDGVRGGATLDVTGFPHPVIKAGHVIIKDSSGVYKPMPLNEGGDAYGTLPEGASYAGYLVASISAKKPIAAPQKRGTINPKATQLAMVTILAAVEAALPLIDYQED